MKAPRLQSRHRAYLGLGSNLGVRESFIQKAIAALKDSGAVVKKVSSIIETQPQGGPPQGNYLNAVVEIRTDRSPEDLLALIRSIEHRLGRSRHVRNGPRTIDIDILLYDDIKLTSRQLRIPHPRMYERDFVLTPLKEIAPQSCC